MRGSRPVSIFDLDGTVSDRDLFVCFLLFVLRRDPARVVRASILPFYLFLRKIGAISTDELKRIFTLTILGRRERATVEGMAEEFAQYAATHYIRPRARAAIESHRQRGDLLVLATASLELYAQPLGLLLGFDRVVATRCRWEGADRLSRDCLISNLKGQAKVDALNAIIDLGSGVETVGYSDSLEDTELLLAVRRGVFVGSKDRDSAKRLGFSLEDWS